MGVTHNNQKRRVLRVLETVEHHNVVMELKLGHRRGQPSLRHLSEDEHGIMNKGTRTPHYPSALGASHIIGVIMVFDSSRNT